MSAHLIPPRRASDPSPGPRRLVKAPVAVHPLPLGEGKDPIPSLSPRERGRRQRWDRCVQREMWDTLSLGGRSGGGEGVNALKPQTTQRCPQVSREGAGRRVVVAQCFQRRGVNCKRTGADPPPPDPAPSADGLKRTPAAVHPLPQGGEGKSRKARKPQQKCRNSRGRPEGRPYNRIGTLRRSCTLGSCAGTLFELSLL
jgi:hypothetical protein